MQRLKKIHAWAQMQVPLLSDYLVTYSGQKSKQNAGKTNQMTSEIKLLTGTKVCYCFN